jgi:hypothetical protein
MNQSQEIDAGALLGGITTDWDLIFDKVQFVQRYGRPIHAYLLALIKNRHEAEDVAQSFLLWVTEHGFPRAKQERGKFRNYLKVALRNAALNYLHRQRRPRTAIDLSQLPDPAVCQPDQLWLAEWRDCLLLRTWRGLKTRQQRLPHDLCYTVLRFTVANPEADSVILASQFSNMVGRPLTSDAFRKQVSRARRVFARILVKEIAQSLDNPTPEQVAEELVDLGLMKYVRGFLPAGWQGWQTVPF